jgi:hypothetical protein
MLNIINKNFKIEVKNNNYKLKPIDQSNKILNIKFNSEGIFKFFLKLSFDIEFITINDIKYYNESNIEIVIKDNVLNLELQCLNNFSKIYFLNTEFISTNDFVNDNDNDILEIKNNIENTKSKENSLEISSSIEEYKYKNIIDEKNKVKFKILSNNIINSIAINLKKLLEIIGFNVNIINELSEKECIESDKYTIYIILYNNSKHKNLPKRFILYQIEQTNSKLFNCSRQINMLKKSEFIWEFSLCNILKYEENINLDKVRYFPMPFFYNNIINNNEDNIKDNIEFDILFYGHLNLRRKLFLEEIGKKYNIKILTLCYGEEKEEYIKKSKIIINLHFYPSSVLESCRINEILKYDKLIISEEPISHDKQNRNIYENIIVFVELLKEDFSNIEKLYDILDFYLEEDNYNKFVRNIKMLKKDLLIKCQDYLYKNLKEIRKVKLDKEIYNEYITDSNLYEYIKYSDRILKPKYILMKIKDCIKYKNHFDVDLNFYKYINNKEEDKSNQEILKEINTIGIENGLIYHPLQIKNLYPEINIYEYNNELYVIYENNKIELKEFVNDKIYKLSFNSFLENFIEIKEEKIEDNRLLVLCFIGNIERGHELINLLIEYKKKERFILGIVFRSKNFYNEFKQKIVENFDNYCLSISNEFGNDIIPSMLIYNYLNKKVKFESIIKLQTKSEITWFNELTNFLLDKNYEGLEILSNKKRCNIIGHEDYYVNLYDKKVFEDKTLLYLKDKYNKLIKKDYFVKGSIFYSKKNVFDKILDFIENNNYKQYFINNFYEINIININNSPIHFIERLFSIYKQ